MMFCFFFFKQKTAYEMRISDWSSDVCSSDLIDPHTGAATPPINAHLLHLHAGIDAVAEPAMHLMLTTGAPDVIREAVASLGTEVGGMDTPISIDPESGRPWRVRFDVKTLATEEDRKSTRLNSSH